jgi:uncharacterized membrane protein
MGGTVMSLSQAIKLFKLGAPLHPILVHFTIALVSVSFFFDAVSFLFSAASLLIAGWWTLCAAFVLTIFTVLTGVKSRMNLPMPKAKRALFCARIWLSA